MIKIGKEKINDFLIELTYLGIVFLIPIYFNFFFSSNDPFESGKMIIFRSLIFVLLFLSVWKISFLQNKKEILVAVFKKYFFIPVILLLYMALSLIWSFNWSWSLFGSSFRQMSFINEVFFFLFLFLLFINLILSNNKGRAYRNLFISVSLSALLVSIYAVLQYFGVDFLIWQEPAVITKRAMSTLGQPNFLASFLLLAIPFTFYLILSENKKYVKVLLLLNLALQLMALLFTGSRGAWVGFFISLLTLPFLFKKSRRFSFISLATVFVIFVFLFLGNNVFSQRFKSAFDLSRGSSSVRTFLYHNSLEAIKDRPWGFGLENQREALIPFYQADLAKNNKVNVVFDRAHNWFLDILLTLGVFGLLIYLWFFSRIFLVIKRNLVLKDGKLFICLFISLLSYFVSLMFNFATVVTVIYSLIIIAIIWSKDFLQEKKSLEIKLTEKRFGHWGLARTIIIFLVLLLSVYGLGRELKKWQADYYYSQFQKSFFQDEIPTSMQLFSYFKKSDVYNRDYYEYFIAMVFDNYTYFRDNSSRFLALEKIREISNLFSDNDSKSYFYNLNRAQILALMGDYNESQNIFSDLEKKSPAYSEIYFKQAQLKLLQRQTQEALEYYDKALRLLPAEESIEGDVNLKSLQSYKGIIEKNRLRINKN